MRARLAPAALAAALTALTALAAASAGCGGSSAPTSGGGATAVFDLTHLEQPVITPTLTEDFYALPFPSDVRLDPDGTVALGTYPRGLGLVDQYIDAIDRSVRGFGTSGAVYFRFDAPLDPASLPAQPGDTLKPSASAFVVDITPGSPTYGQRVPVTARFVARRYDFIGPNWVALQPVPGLPLRERTTYAAVITDGVRAQDGKAVRRAPDFEALLQRLQGKSPEARPPGLDAAVKAYGPLAEWLKGEAGLEGRLASVAVFTTRDVTSIMGELRAAVHALAPAPTLDGLRYTGEGVVGVNRIYDATFQSPNFQEGDPPYAVTGGRLHRDTSGKLAVVRTEALRVCLSVPEGPMPAAGWPVVVYAHGTGGSYRSFLVDGSAQQAAAVADRSGDVLAKLAMVSIDQVLHGPRDPSGGDPQINFFNFQNIEAAHDNPKQGALDDFQLVRLLKGIDVKAAEGSGEPIKFDPERIYFKGHSQGALTGPLFLAAEPDVKAAVLSGGGALLLLSLTEKKAPIDVPALVSVILRDPIDEAHPMLNLLQSYLDDVDPLNYARLLSREPPAGQPPKSIFHSVGLVDHYTPVHSGYALGLALGAQPIRPQIEEIPNLALAGLSWGQTPISGNAAGGAATSVMLQYRQDGPKDGHFVIFDVAAAIAQSNRFLATHAAGGVARLYVP